jgi:hypothetical protein
MSGDLAPNRLPNNLPQSEVDRQTGSGKCNPSQRGYGVSPMQNNFDPSVKAPVNGVFLSMPKYQVHQPVINKFNFPTQMGGSFAPHRHHFGVTAESNPAINNWKPGTRIKEPMNVFEYSTGSQVHSGVTDPIRYTPNRGHLIQGRLSSDDGKPLSSTQRYIDRPFVHVAHNPLRGHSA